jgi:hypothetical protein
MSRILGYKGAAVRSGVPETTSERYVRWARKFAVSTKGKPLRARSVEDVRGFLEDLESHDDTEPIRHFYSKTTVLPSRKDVPFKCSGKYK